MDELLVDENVPFEEDICRHPYSIKHWFRYIDAKKNSNASEEVVNILYERALKQLPGSYKLWYSYLQWRKKSLDGKGVFSPGYKQVNHCFERSLVFMHKMPRIWIEYLKLLMLQHNITRIRRTFDRALQALPITQHLRIWPLYLEFIKSYNIPETALRVFKRYLKLQPEDTEDFIDYLRGAGRLDEAAQKLYEIVNDERFLSKEGKSKHQLWHELCELISKNPDKVHSLKVENIIREGIKQYQDEQGKLWNALAEYFIRSGLFERARDIYEEGISSITTIKDFALIFDAYSQSEESFIKSMMEKDVLTKSEELDLEWRLARYEYLVERRPLLLNSVALRQNPHNVDEWHKRVKLLDGKPLEIIETFTEAVDTVDPKLATGKYYSLWVEFAKFYEKNDQLEDARLIFKTAVKAPYSKVNDLACVWCEFAEMELRHNSPGEAIELMKQATAVPAKKGKYHDDTEPVQNRVYRSLKLWSMYADLEESFGTFQSTKAVYDRILDLRIATPQLIMNCALFLEENRYFEEAFKVYERGLALFKWPNVFDIWNAYLTKFLARYKGSKLERARDLFQQCLSSCPKEYAKNFYLLYAKLEEEYGLAKHAMSIYEKATREVHPKHKFEMFNIYIKKAAENFGITYTRAIYEKAIESLSDMEAREMCLKFADLERKLGEIDRARAIYSHCSQMSDPRTYPEFWAIWKEFEIRHGNEDTIREMLRIRRSVEATFNTQVNFMAAQMVSTINESSSTGMAAVESQVEKEITARKEISFVSSSTTKEILSSNPDEIDIDENDVSQPDLESSLEVGGFGYPAMVALNVRKMKFSTLRGPFSLDGINEFLRDLSYGRGSSIPVRGAKLPKIVQLDPWDGKDGVAPSIISDEL
ncbi:pre-mRNA-splicing factor SYF1-like [Brevipalpus obovatus]|uniref:pre-mRNA-splicing factor SYF1-like n=1 Tax=Brevipalpus obovatus TaxID=246614 RepID=UPI003D9F4530